MKLYQEKLSQSQDTEGQQSSLSPTTSTSDFSPANSPGDDRPIAPRICPKTSLLIWTKLSPTPSVALLGPAMAIRPPEPGTVIHLSYLWADEQAQGREEGTKDRPCVIVITTRQVEGATLVTVVPVTSSPQSDNALEIPPEIKARLGLDPGKLSWVVCSEVNRFEWPGPDLRPIPHKGGWDYGRIPDHLLLQIQRMLRARAGRRPLRVVSRTS